MTPGQHLQVVLFLIACAIVVTLAWLAVVCFGFFVYDQPHVAALLAAALLPLLHEVIPEPGECPRCL